MRFKDLLLFIFLATLLSPGALWARDGEQEYQKARQNYQRLLDSPRKQQYRDQWDRVIQGLSKVSVDFPRHPRAPDALYLAGKACRGLYEVSRRRSDAVRSVEFFTQIADRYPSSSLADDGLVLAGEIQESLLRDPAAAYLSYARAASEFSGGDLAPRGRSKAAELVAHAPPAPSIVSGAEASPAPLPSGVGSGAGGELSSIRFWCDSEYTRVVLDLSGSPDYRAKFLPADPQKGIPPRIYIDLPGTCPGPAIQEKTDVQNGLLKQIRVGRPDGNTVRVVLDLAGGVEFKDFPLRDPSRVVLDMAAGTVPNPPPVEIQKASRGNDGIAAVLDQVPAEPPLKFQMPAAKESGALRRIVVDPGHGGRDPGAIGPSGILEKDITLAMAKVLAQRLKEELGCEVILTRTTDVFLELGERTAMANRVGADLFISIHANASPNREAFGIETYYLNFSKNEMAAAVAARENGTSLKEVGDLELILFDLMANSKINESSRLAAEIQKVLVDDLTGRYSHIRDLGVKQGPFHVLLGATMPSVLVEAAFISNRREESRLSDGRYQKRAIEAIVKAVRNYAESHKLMASR